MEVSTQSTTPVIRSPVHSRLCGPKSRCRKHGSHGGSPAASTSKARRQVSGASDQSGTTHFAGNAHDWNVRGIGCDPDLVDLRQQFRHRAQRSVGSPRVASRSPGSQVIRWAA